MKLYKTTGGEDHLTFTEVASSSSDASKARTRLKKAGLEDVKTEEIEVEPTRSGIIALVNSISAHPSCLAEQTAEKLAK